MIGFVAGYNLLKLEVEFGLLEFLLIAQMICHCQTRAPKYGIDILFCRYECNALQFVILLWASIEMGCL